MEQPPSPIVLIVDDAAIRQLLTDLSAATEARRFLLELGVDAYIAKPLDIEMLLMVAREMCGLSGVENRYG